MGNVNNSNEGGFLKFMYLSSALNNNRFPRKNGCGCSSIIVIIFLIAFVIMVFTSPFKLINNLVNGEEVSTSTVFGFIFFMLIIIFFLIAIMNGKNDKNSKNEDNDVD